MRHGLKEQVISLHRERPKATSQELADILGCHSAYVRSTLRRSGLSLYRAHNARLSPSIKVIVSDEYAAALEPHAEKRALSVPQLVDRLIGVITSDNLVDPLLDDGVAA